MALELPDDVADLYFKCACGCGREGYAPEALPLAAAAYLERMAKAFRELLHQLPEYTHNSLAWRVMNDIDHTAARLREEPPPSVPKAPGEAA